MNGRPSQQQKDKHRKQELVQMFRNRWGLKAIRVPLSGAVARIDGTGRNDVDVYIEGRDAPFICEVETSQDMIPEAWQKYLDEFDFIAVKKDGKPWWFLLTEKMFEELMRR